MAASLEENNAAELQSLVTPSNFEQIAADLVEVELEKKRLRDERLRASQARSMARMTGEILLSPEVEVSRKAQKKYMDMVQVRNQVGISFLLLYFCCIISNNLLYFNYCRTSTGIGRAKIQKRETKAIQEIRLSA